MILRHIHLLLFAALLAVAFSEGNAASLKTTPSKTADALRASCQRHLEKNENAAAIADCNRAIALEPGNRDGYLTRGKIYLFMNDLDRAVADFDRALAIKPDSAGVLTLRGLAYFRKNDYDRAIADYKKAIRLWPEVRLPKSLLAQAEEARAKRTSSRK